MKQSARLIHFITCQSGINSTQVNKNINRLGKHENDLITPNKYTFDLLSLTLFSVDTFDSQISANNFSQDNIGTKLPYDTD